MDVEKLLAAIEETERNAEEAKQMRWVFDTNRRNGRTVMKEFFTRNDPAAVLRRCAADRSLVVSYKAVAEYDDWENSYEHATGRAVGLGEAVRLIAEAYGLSVEEETTGE